MKKQQLTIICLLVIVSFTTIEATIYCPDPLNIQAGSRSDSPASPNSASAAGVVTCDAAFNAAGSCGIVIASGAGICTTATTSSPTVVVTALRAAAATTAPADISAFTTAQGAIKSCWNPAAKAQATIATPLSATNAILACYTITATNVGSAILQTVGTTTTASSAVTLTTGSGTYCFTTNCNSAISTINFNIATILIGSITAFLSL